MQITLNKVPFDVSAVEGTLRSALLADPAIATGVSREVWAWDGTAGRWLVPVTQDQALPLPVGLTVYVPRAGSGAPEKADGPTRRMAERLMAAVGATSMGQIMQAVARVTGVPKKTLPLEPFAAAKAAGPLRIAMEVEFAVLSLANAARNLQAYLFVPGLVAFRHEAETVPEGVPAPGSIRPGFVIPPLNQATHAMRRMAVARRLTEIQADLGDLKPGDLPEGDPRRLEIAKLGAEWRALQTQPKATRAA